MSSLRKHFVLLIFFFSASALSFEISQIGKLSSRKDGSPIARQGSCLLFQTQGHKYCASVHHVAFTENGPEFQHSVKTSYNEQLSLKYIASEWAIGLSLYEVVTATKSEFIDFRDLDWAVEFPKNNTNVLGYGFPVSSSEPNTIYGTYLSLSVEAAQDLFLMVPSVILISNMASELGLSGGALVDENEKILGLLSHQVIQSGKVLTMALPAAIASKWLGETLNAIHRKQIVQSYFLASEYMDESQNGLQLSMLGARFSMTEFPKRPNSACCTSPWVTLSGVRYSDEKIPNFGFPVFSKLGQMATNLDQKIEMLKEEYQRRHNMPEDQQAFHKKPYFLGCSISDTMMSADDPIVFKRSLEVLHGIREIALQKTRCKDLVFVNTGTIGHLIADDAWNILKYWQEHFLHADLTSAAEWKKKWEDLIAFCKVGRSDKYSPVNKLEIAWKTPEQLEAYLANDEYRQKAYAIFPKEVFQLELLMRQLIQRHRVGVYREPAFQIFDLPGESSDWLILFPSSSSSRIYP